ncbi:NAD(P)-dependent dehydrogenase (short-subunit alcohol dehydrogenase family) [Sphingobium wenxiniae]|nr:NAD(P)-dependent dehydrogenase (short-subunit alcohol dehydrogenase family) [Sphingobium wenxiniae]TWH95911.1 NAD(P)-dependent dehydrogenase (short-subunit alcohol dehydrogenase family) [Sphingobium wenxiniae]
MEDMFGLIDKVAIVWGGGSGMGEATALRLARAGCDVAVVDLDIALAEAVAAKISALGRRAIALAANVTDEQQVDRAVAETESGLGPIGVMVTVVGMAGFGPVLDITSEQWDREQSINLKSVFLTAKSVARTMVRNGGGAITAICSVSGLTSAPRHASYGAAKAGVAHLVRSMGAELAPRIRVNAVAPGTIETQRVKATEERIAAIERRVPMARMGSVDEIAKAVLFLSSDLASFVTGQTLAVDGGWTSQFLMDAHDSSSTDKDIDWEKVSNT